MKKAKTITGLVASTAILSAGSLNASTLFNYDALGTGAELRSELLNNNIVATDSFGGGFEKSSEAKCGEAKCGDKKKSKTAEHKCGEGKCGGKKKSKTAEHKCGEGKCGGKKKSKTAEHKCGEGKCGNKKK